MFESYRLTVLKRLTQLVETTPIGEDATLNGAVFRGRTIFGPSDPMPLVSIIESTKVEQGTFAGINDEARKGVWPLILQGWTDNDQSNPSDEAYQFMAAVEATLWKACATLPQTGDPSYPDEYMLGSGGQRAKYLIAGMTYGPGLVVPPREGVSSSTFFFLPVYITLYEKMGQPYFTV